MRNLFVFASLLATLSACGGALPPEAAMQGHPNDEASIVHVLDDFHDAAARADEPRYFDHFADSGVFLGTDATERWDVNAFRAYAHPHFAKGKAWDMHAVRRHVTISPAANVAYFDEELETKKLGPARGSGVLLRIQGRWRIAQYNLAITVPNERFGDVKRLLDAAPEMKCEASSPPVH